MSTRILVARAAATALCAVVIIEACALLAIARVPAPLSYWTAIVIAIVAVKSAAAVWEATEGDQ